MREVKQNVKILQQFLQRKVDSSNQYQYTTSRQQGTKFNTRPPVKLNCTNFELLIGNHLIVLDTIPFLINLIITGYYSNKFVFGYHSENLEFGYHSKIIVSTV